LARVGALQRALLGCWTKDTLRTTQACAGLHDLLYGPDSDAAFKRAGASISDGTPRGKHLVAEDGGGLWLHALMPLSSVRIYALRFRQSGVTLRTEFHPDHMWGGPMTFDTLADAEAAAVMFQELCEIKGNDETANFVVEFSWRPETMRSFFEVETSATSSKLVKITVPDPEDEDEEDDLKFRVNLNPESMEDSGMNMHRLSLQLVGGKSSARTYAIFFHTIDPKYQVHINVPDHRVPIFPTKEVFHHWHPLMAGLRHRPRLRFLVRLKGLEKGPLDAMCGCCG